MAISSDHRRWIAQAEAWRSAIEYRLSDENIDKYDFLSRTGDLFITTMGLFGSSLNDVETTPVDTGKLFEAVASAFEVFSMPSTRGYFNGVNPDKNLLLVAAAYYLAGYTASATVIAKFIKPGEDWSDADWFMYLFFIRTFHSDNSLMQYLQRFLESGDTQILMELLSIVATSKSVALKNDPEEYFSYKVIHALLRQFTNENIWHDLLLHNENSHWGPLVKHLIAKSMWGLFPSQRLATSLGAFDLDKTLSLQMPTSSGKTALSKLLIYNQITLLPNSKILFLAPFRALASELNRELVNELKELGVSSYVMYGGKEPEVGARINADDYQLIISTPEKFLACESYFVDVLPNVSTIICDEGHLLDDSQRGLGYELLLTRLKSAQCERRRFIFISAIVPNLEDVNAWLGGNDDTICRSQYRPTKNEYAYLKRKPNRQFDLEVNPLAQLPIKFYLHKFIRDDDFKFMNEATNRQNTYGAANPSQLCASVFSARKLLPTGAVMLFAPNKGKQGVEALANELIRQIENHIKLPSPADYAVQDTVSQLVEYFDLSLGADYPLCKLIRHGAILHHGDLPQFIRELIEDAVGKEQVRLLICTSTISEGVNLPIRSIVLHTLKRFEGMSQNGQPNYVNLRHRDIKNLVGRAGRAGKNTKGLVVLANETEQEILKPVIQDVPGEKIQGALLSLVSKIADFIRKHQLQISNEILESQKSEVLRSLLDDIDSSLINLMGEHVEPSELENHVKALAEETFAFYKSNEEEKSALTNLFAQRAQRLGRFQTDRDISILKSTGASIRAYEFFCSRFNFEEPIWITISSPIEAEWLELISSTILEMPQIKSALGKFNDHNNLGITGQQVMTVIRRWISGEWYPTIARTIGCSTGSLLKLMSQVILFHISLQLQTLVRLAEAEFERKDFLLSETIRQWSKHLEYGVPTDVGLSLLAIGLSDRFAVLQVAAWIQSHCRDQTLSHDELREVLISNREILAKNAEQLPRIAHDRLRSFLGSLT